MRKHESQRRLGRAPWRWAATAVMLLPSCTQAGDAPLIPRSATLQDAEMRVDTSTQDAMPLPIVNEAPPTADAAEPQLTGCRNEEARQFTYCNMESEQRLTYCEETHDGGCPDPSDVEGYWLWKEVFFTTPHTFFSAARAEVDGGTGCCFMVYRGYGGR